MCMFGFSVAYTNTFSEHLERRCRALDRSFRESTFAFSLGLSDLHTAVDDGLAGDAASSSAALEQGLARLATANDHLTVIGEAFVQSRADLFERGKIDPSDPLIAREACFGAIDYDGLYHELVACGAALPHRVYWDDVAPRMRGGGARAALRVLDRQLRRLQSRLRAFASKVASRRNLPLGVRAAALHDTSFEVAALALGYDRLLATMTYMSIVCERASQLYEASTGEVTAAVSAAG